MVAGQRFAVVSHRAGVSPGVSAVQLVLTHQEHSRPWDWIPAPGRRESEVREENDTGNANS